MSTDLSPQSYRHQLDQVLLALKKDPNNASLSNLAQKLQNLISLNDKEQQQQQNFPPSSSSTRHLQKFRLGETCEARCQADGQWYEAVVHATHPEFSNVTIVFAGTADTQHCIAKEIRKLTAHPKRRISGSLVAAAASVASIPAPLPLDTKTGDAEEVKKPSPATAGNHLIAGTKRKPTREEHRQKKELEHFERQQSWKSFSTKLQKISKKFD